MEPVITRFKNSIHSNYVKYRASATDSCQSKSEHCALNVAINRNFTKGSVYRHIHKFVIKN